MLTAVCLDVFRMDMEDIIAGFSNGSSMVVDADHGYGKFYFSDVDIGLALRCADAAHKGTVSKFGYFVNSTRRDAQPKSGLNPAETNSAL
jgi:hypothetical protein